MISTLNITEALINLDTPPPQYANPKYPYEDVKTLASLKKLAEKLSTKVSLKVWEIIDGKRVEIKDRLPVSAPKYFLIDLDTETSGDKKEDGEIHNLSKYLELIQLSIHTPKIIEKEIVAKNGRKFIFQELAIDDLCESQTYLIHFSKLERDWENKKAASPNKLASNPIADIKSILEDSQYSLDIMHAEFEFRQFALRFGFKFTSIIDIEVLAKKLFSDDVCEYKYKDDIESKIESEFKKALTDFLNDHLGLAVKESNISFDLDLISPKTYNLAALTRVILGEFLNKDNQASDWALENLSPEQIEYAVLDPEISHRILLALLNFQSDTDDKALQLIVEANKVGNSGSLPEIEVLEKQIENLIEQLQELYRQKYNLIKQSSEYQTIIGLIVAEKLVTETINKVLLPKIFEKEKVTILASGASVPSDFEVSFTTPYGNAHYRPSKERDLDLEKLKVFGDSIFSALKLDITKTKLEEVVGKKKVKEIWDKFVQKTFQEPRLQLEFNFEGHNIPKLDVPDFKIIFDALGLDTSIASLENSEPAKIIEHHLKQAMACRKKITDLLIETQLLKKLVSLTEQIRILRQVVYDKSLEVYALKNQGSSDQSDTEDSSVRNDSTEVTVREELAHNTKFGFATLKPSTSTIKDIAGIINACPEILTQIKPSISEDALRKFLKEQGVKSQLVDSIVSEILPVINYKNYTSRTSPKYGGIYK